MTMYITHFVIIPLRVNNVVFGNACFSDNILLNCESMVRTQKLSEETFFYCAVSSYRNVFVAKNYTMLFDSTQRPSTLVVKSNQSNPSFRHVTPRSTKVLVKTCTSVQIKKIKVY